MSCGDDNVVEEICGVANPVTELQWIQTYIDDYKKESPNFTQYLYLTQSEYENQTVFIFGNCCPSCNSVFTVFDCNGQEIGAIGEIDINILYSGEVIWKAENSVCTN